MTLNLLFPCALDLMVALQSTKQGLPQGYKGAHRHKSNLVSHNRTGCATPDHLSTPTFDSQILDYLQNHLKSFGLKL